MSEDDQLKETAALIIADLEYQANERSMNDPMRAKILYEVAVLKRAIACARAALEETP